MYQKNGELYCDGDLGCAKVVTYIDDKGYVYCRVHGIARKSWRRCRKLTSKELKWMKAGKPLGAY